MFIQQFSINQQHYLCYPPVIKSTVKSKTVKKKIFFRFFFVFQRTGEAYHSSAALNFVKHIFCFFIMNDQELREVFDYHGKERLVDGKSGAIGKNKDVPVHVKSFYPPGELARKAKLLAMLRACGVCIRKNHVDAALKEVGVRLKTRRGFAKPVRSVCVYLLFYQTHKTRVNRTGSRSTILKRCTRPVSYTHLTLPTICSV